MKELDLSSDVAIQLQAYGILQDDLGKHIASILTTAVEDSIVARKEIWDGLAQKFGFKNLAEIRSKGFDLKVNYITEKVQLIESMDDIIEHDFNTLINDLKRDGKEELAEKVRLLFMEV